MKTIAQIGAEYRNGSLTPLQVVADAHERIVLRNGLLNAFADSMYDASTFAAQQAERALKRGDDLGPMHGIPIAIKDIIDVAGARTAYGSKVEMPKVAQSDATLVARLRAAGAIILGKTQCLEYAYGFAHPLVGQTNNPLDPARTAGGSSGGSAAAVADGIVPAAIGTDTGGSIRIPAAYCGIVGLKPSFGLVPLNGVFPLSQSLDHAGPITRTVADAAVVLACIAGQGMPLQVLRTLRVGVLRQHFPIDRLNRRVAEVVETALARLGSMTVRDVSIPALDKVNSVLMDLLLPEASLIHSGLAKHNSGGYAIGTLSQIRAGECILATRYLAARQQQALIRAAVDALFDQCDVLLSVTVPFTAPFEDPEIANESDSEILATGFSNVTGHPSIALPCGMIDGLPVSLQLTGVLGGDAALLSAAMLIERTLAV